LRRALVAVLVSEGLDEPAAAAAGVGCELVIPLVAAVVGDDERSEVPGSVRLAPMSLAGSAASAAA